MAFVNRQKQRRFLELLASKRGRQKILDQLPHFRDFDPEVVGAIAPSLQTPPHIEKALRELGAPQRCFVISENEVIDGTEMDLSTALNDVVGRVWAPSSLASHTP